MAKSKKQQAQESAALAYAPQKSALAQALGEAAAARDQQIQAAKALGQGQVAAVDATRPQVQQVYANSENTLRGTLGNYGQAVQAVQSGQAPTSPTTVAGYLANLGPAAGSIVQGQLASQNQALLNEQAEGARSLRDLAMQRAQAATGITQGVNAANSDYSAAANKVLGQLQDVTAQEGAKASTTYDDLVNTSAQRAVTKRGQDLTAASQAASQSETRRHNATSESIAQQNADTATAKAEDGGGTIKTPKLTLVQQSAALDKIREAQTWARNLARGQNATPENVHSKLVTGATLDVGGGQKIKVPAYSDIYVQAAMELNKGGKITNSTANSLRSRGFQIPSSWLRKPSKAGSNIAGGNSTGTGLVP